MGPGIPPDKLCPGSLTPGTPNPGMRDVAALYGRPPRVVRCSVCGRLVSVQTSYHMDDLLTVRHMQP